MMELNNNSFYQQVYEIIKLIPKGRVTTYGLIAKALGSAKSSTPLLPQSHLPTW